MEVIDVAAAIIEKDSRFLIAKRKKGKLLENKWEFPGGKIESGETAQECLKRELEEEFGIITEIKDFAAESIFDYGEKSIRLLGYYAEYISGEFRLNAHDEIKWISRDEFSNFDFADADILIVKKIIASNI